jgi:ubiquinone/menaquinone biosynthesis C-methylase UbiE
MTTPWSVDFFRRELGRPRGFLVELVEKGMIRGHKVLDTCCGLGTNGLFLAEKGFEVTGIDISDDAVKIANQRARKEAKGGRAYFQVENFMKMEFEAMSFDFVLDAGCFHHVTQEDRHSFIENVHRTLRPSSRYLLMCFSDRMGQAWNHFSEGQIRELFSARFDTLPLDEISSEEGDGATRYFFVALLEKAGAQ